MLNLLINVNPYYIPMKPILLLTNMNIFDSLLLKEQSIFVLFLLNFQIKINIAFIREVKRKEKKRVEKLGIDPNTSRMLSERSTI